MGDEEKLPPKLELAEKKSDIRRLRIRAVPQFKPVACFLCGTTKFNVKLKMEKRRMTKMQLACAECGRKTLMTIRKFE